MKSDGIYEEKSYHTHSFLDAAVYINCHTAFCKVFFQIKLSGDLSEAELKAILSQHEKDLQAALDKHNSAKEKQLADLRHKLEERRRKRERELRDKQKKEVGSFSLTSTERFVSMLK